MRKSRFTESQIVAILKEADSGLPVKDVVRKHGTSAPACYKWKSRYGGMDVAGLARVRKLEQENSKLMRMYTDLALESAAPQRSWYRAPADALAGNAEVIEALQAIVDRHGCAGGSGSASGSCGWTVAPGTTSGCGGCTASSD